MDTRTAVPDARRSIPFDPVCGSPLPALYEANPVLRRRLHLLFLFRHVPALFHRPARRGAPRRHDPFARSRSTGLTPASIGRLERLLRRGARRGPHPAMRYWVVSSFRAFLHAT